jgi:nitric oxide reductase NorD protein
VNDIAVHFADQRKPLAWWLRALWNDGTALHPFGATLSAARPYRSNIGLHFPDQYRAVQGAGGALVYRAGLAHLAAHHAFSGPPRSRKGLKPVQVALFGVLEDARVEHLAMREFPGLRRLWSRFHVAQAGGSASTFLSLAARLRRRPSVGAQGPLDVLPPGR